MSNIKFDLPQLKYAMDALAPHISANTMDFHYNKHHKTYLDNLNKIIEEKQLKLTSLEDIISFSANKPEFTALFNNAAQVWNHNFFWDSLHPGAGTNQLLNGNYQILQQIKKDFGDYSDFTTNFINKAIGQFGSGWVWLVWCPKSEKLEIMNSSNADLPLIHDKIALLTCDVWEHAYYLDYQNLRKKFVEIFLENLAFWDFADKNFTRAVSHK